MLKRAAFVALGLLLWGLGGCTCQKYKDQNQDLRNGLDSLRNQNEELRLDRNAYKQRNDDLQQDLDDARNQARNYEGQLKAERERQRKLLAQKQKLEALAKTLEKLVIFVTRDGRPALLMKSDILFASGQASLRAEALKALDGIGQYLQENASVRIRIDGHTDGQPIRLSEWSDNWHLSCMRALAVRKYLAQKGVEESRMYVAGFGPSRPLEKPVNPTDPMEGNRRVEIIVEMASTEPVGGVSDDI